MYVHMWSEMVNVERVWVLLAGCCVRVCCSASSTAVPKELIALLANTTRYNKHASPTQDTDIPTMVNISMYIEGISSFRATSMDFQLDIYFQQRWVDHRLQHDNKRRILVKDPQVFGLMWHPDLYFANARLASFHEVTEPNFLVWIHQNGTVYYDCRISLTVMCMQNFVKYPMDEQECNLRILSYAYDTDQLNLTWIDKDAVVMNPDIVMADMILVNVTPDRVDVEYPTGWHFWPGVRPHTEDLEPCTGLWALATATFYVRREIMHHILQNYVPTGLIVIISWFSFWLDVDSVPGRVSLSITTLLTLATQATAARLALPQVSYIKAIDVWMGTCMAFVFGAMIEFTIVNYWSRRKTDFRPFGGLKSWFYRQANIHKRLHCKCSRQGVGGGSHSHQMRAFYGHDADDDGAGSRELNACVERSLDHIHEPKYFTAYEISAPVPLGAGRHHTDPLCDTPLINNGDVQQQQQLRSRTTGGGGDGCLLPAEPLLYRNAATPIQMHYASNDFHSLTKCDACRRRDESLSAGGRGSSDARSRRKSSAPGSQLQSRKVAQKIDQKCRWIFPAAFIAFNLFYWPFYKTYEVSKASNS